MMELGSLAPTISKMACRAVPAGLRRGSGSLEAMFAASGGLNGKSGMLPTVTIELKFTDEADNAALDFRQLAALAASWARRH